MDRLFDQHVDQMGNDLEEFTNYMTNVSNGKETMATDVMRQHWKDKVIQMEA